MHRAHSQALAACRIRDGIIATPEEVTRALRALAEYLATVPEPYAEPASVPLVRLAAPTAWAIRDTGGEWWLGGDGDNARWGSESDDARTFATFDAAEKWAEALCADGFDCFADRHPSAPDPRDARIADLEEQLRRRTCERDEAVSVSAEWRTERHEYARIAESYRQRVARMERMAEAARALVRCLGPVGCDEPFYGPQGDEPRPDDFPVCAGCELRAALAALDRGAA